MGRQLINAAVAGLLAGLGIGGLMCVIAFSENLSSQIVDTEGHLDLGFLAMMFLTWAAPVALAVFLITLLVGLVVSGVRWAIERRHSPAAD